ncbi:MAG TPA: GNVR domain-containing protein, partial [Gemmatimonadaceae bacterium]
MTAPDSTLPPSPDDGASDEISLAELVDILLDARRLVAGVAGAIFLIGLLYALFAAPVYTPSALLQVNQKAGGLSGLETLSSMLEGTALPVAAEIQLAQSSSVLRAAVEAQRADVLVRPRRFPLFGGLLARRYRGAGPAPARLGLSGFSWGKDHVTISRFDVPRRLYDEDFRLTVTGPDAYRLQDPDGATLFAGRVGAVARADSGMAGDSIVVLVAAIDARPGVSFTVRRLDRQEAVARIADRLRVEEQGAQSGILRMTLSGGDPRTATDLLAAIVSADVALNRSLRSQQAAAQIDFLQDQLPLMQARVDSARRRLGEYQSKHRVLNLSDESKALLDRLSAIDQAITTAALQRAQLQQQFGAASPALRAAQAQQDTLQQQRAQLEVQVARLPGAAQSVLQLQENLAVASNLYSGLLTSIQQLQVVKAGTVGDLSVVDLPIEPDRPSGPPRLTILIVALLVGLFVGALAAFVRRAFVQRVEDPALIEARFRLPVVAVLPFSVEQSRREKALPDRRTKEPLLAEENPHDPAVEAMRGLRTSLHFLVPAAERPVVCISGPVSGVGKSFICANLARLAADAGTRVLVLDADMRRGHLHRYFGVPREPGLSALLSGTADAASVIRETGVPNLRVVTA